MTQTPSPDPLRDFLARARATRELHADALPEPLRAELRRELATHLSALPGDLAGLEARLGEGALELVDLLRDEAAAPAPAGEDPALAPALEACARTLVEEPPPPDVLAATRRTGLALAVAMAGGSPGAPGPTPVGSRPLVRLLAPVVPLGLAAGLAFLALAPGRPGLEPQGPGRPRERSWLSAEAAPSPASLPAPPDDDPEALFQRARRAEVAGDLKAAFAGYRAAAEARHPKAQNNLGLMLLDGRGAPADPAAGEAWLGRAAAQGHLLAMLNLGRWHDRAAAFDPARYEPAARWYGEAARIGDPYAGYMAGRYAELGLGRPADPAEARDWYRRASGAGLAEARYELGRCLTRGVGGPTDVPGGLDLFFLAADGGNADAAFELGRRHEFGDGVPRNRAAAFEWYQKAARTGHLLAGERLEELERSRPGR